MHTTPMTSTLNPGGAYSACTRSASATATVEAVSATTAHAATTSAVRRLDRKNTLIRGMMTASGSRL